MGRLKTLVVNILVIALIVGAYAVYSWYHKGSEEEHQVLIYLIQSTPTDFDLVPVERTIEGPLDPTKAMQAQLKGPLAHEDLSAPVPEGTRLLDLTVQGTLATANFSRDITQKFTGGSLMEAYLVEAIVKTLTQFPDIDMVQILVEGETVESIGGHILISKPLRKSN